MNELLFKNRLRLVHIALGWTIALYLGSRAIILDVGSGLVCVSLSWIAI